MPRTENQIYDEAMLLPHLSKIFLVEKLLENIGENIDPETEAFQIREAKRRRDEIRSGQVLPMPGEEQLTALIRQAGDEARARKKKAMELHYKKLKAAIAEGVSRGRKRKTP